MHLSLAGVDDPTELEARMAYPERSFSTDGTCHMIGDQSSCVDIEPAGAVPGADESADWCGDKNIMMTPDVLDEVHAADGMRSHGDTHEQRRASTGVTGQGVTEQVSVQAERAPRVHDQEDACGDAVSTFDDVS